MIAANVAILLALAVLAELVFGSIFFGENYGVLVVDRNVSRRFDATERYGGGMTEYLRDHHGLRGQYPDPSQIDILTIGGSTTNEILIDEGKTWSDRLFKTASSTCREAWAMPCSNLFPDLNSHPTKFASIPIVLTLQVGALIRLPIRPTICSVIGTRSP